MKKSLLVLAVLGTLAGSASAQTSLSVYGLADAGFVREMSGPNGAVWKLTSGIQNGSRLGFKGTEDLGRGLQAKFLLEAGINIDDGTSGQSTQAVPPGTVGFQTRAQTNRLFGRQAYVGLGSQWGSVTLGREYTPHYLALAEIDPFGAGLAGNAANFIPTTLRMDNTIKYTSPTWSGLTADIGYGFGEQPGDNSRRRQYGASVGYANGPLTVKAAYHHIDGDVPEANFPTIVPGAVAGVPLNETAHFWLIGGKWDFGIAAVHLAYDETKAERTIVADSRDWLIGASAPLGPGTILFSYIHKSDRTNLNGDAKQYAIGYTYPLSKRTNLYTSYAQISNERDVLFTAGNATERGTGEKQFNVGIRHIF